MPAQHDVRSERFWSTHHVPNDHCCPSSSGKASMCFSELSCMWRMAFARQQHDGNNNNNHNHNDDTGRSQSSSTNVRVCVAQVLIQHSKKLSHSMQMTFIVDRLAAAVTFERPARMSTSCREPLAQYCSTANTSISFCPTCDSVKKGHVLLDRSVKCILKPRSGVSQTHSTLA